MTDVEIEGPMIRLGQLLKLAGLVDSGGEVRAVIASGSVTVGGIPELRRGRQLHHGDTVEFGGRQVRVVARPA